MEERPCSYSRMMAKGYGDDDIFKHCWLKDTNRVISMVSSPEGANAYDSRTDRHVLAYAWGMPDTVRLTEHLLNHGATPEICPDVFHFMFSQKDPAIMRTSGHMLVKAGFSVNFSDWTMQHPLHMMCSGHFYSAAEVLLELGADPDAVDAQGRKPCDRIIFEEERQRFEELFDRFRPNAPAL